MPTYREPEKIDNELHRLMLRAVPFNERGHKTLLYLSDLIGVSKWAMRKWIIAKKLSPDRVKQLVEIGKMGEPHVVGGRVHRNDFETFVYND